MNALNPSVEYRRTDWVEFRHHGYSAYRITMRRSQWGVEQRHEWRRDDGSARNEGWIRSGASMFDALGAPIEATEVAA